MVYKPEMDKRAKRPKEDSLQGRDIASISTGIKDLIEQQKVANENTTTGFAALKDSGGKLEKWAQVGQLMEVVATRKQGSKTRAQETKHHKDKVKIHGEHTGDRGDAEKTRKTVGAGARGRGTEQSTYLQDLAEVAHIDSDRGQEMLGHFKNLDEIATDNAYADAKNKQFMDKWRTIDMSVPTGIEAMTLEMGRQHKKTMEWTKKTYDLGISGPRVWASKLRLKKIEELTTKIEEQKKIMAATADTIEGVGKSAMESKEYRKQALELAKLEKTRAKTTGSKEAEKTAKARIKEIKSQTVLRKMAKGIGQMAGWMGKAAKTVAGKMPSFGKLLTLGAFGAILAFMNSPAMAKVEKFILEDVIPKFGKWYDKTFKPMWDGFLEFLEKTTIPGLWLGIEQALTNMGPIITDLGNIFKALGEGKLLEALGHVFNLLLDSVIFIIDAVGNILKSLGLDFFEGPSLTAAMKKGMVTMNLDDLPWWIPVPWLKSLRDKHLTTASEIADVNKQILQFEAQQKGGLLGEDVQQLEDLRITKKNLEAEAAASTIAAATARTTMGEPGGTSWFTEGGMAANINNFVNVDNRSASQLLIWDLKPNSPIMLEVLGAGGGG